MFGLTIINNGFRIILAQICDFHKNYNKDLWSLLTMLHHGTVKMSSIRDKNRRIKNLF